MVKFPHDGKIDGKRPHFTFEIRQTIFFQNIEATKAQI